jgi:hypothetical protein
MGSSGDDYPYRISVDGTGNTYVAGKSDGSWGSPVNPYTGDVDAFAAKLNGSGVLQWNTFMGSSGEDYAYGIAVDRTGNVYVAGGSDGSWGWPVNAYTGYADTFVAKLDSSGVLQWNTFMGSSDYDFGFGIAVDGTENVYVAGGSDGSWGSPVSPYTGSFDAFAAKLNGSGVLQWNTFMGSPGEDYAYGIAVDGTGNVYVAGWSDGSWGWPVNAYTGYADTFAARLGSSGVLQCNTFMGSSNDDAAYDIAVDGSRNVYVAGFSEVTWGSPVQPFGGFLDAFAAKLVLFPPLIPTMTVRGLIIFSIILVGSALWIMRRRARAGPVLRRSQQRLI